MAHLMPLDGELDEEERELERQILVLERKAKLRQRLKELRAAEEASDNHVGSPRKDSGEQHVLGIDPEPRDALQEAIKGQPPSDKQTGRNRNERAEPPRHLPIRPSPATNLPPPTAPKALKQSSPSFWSLSVFGLLGCAAPGSSKRSTTRVVGVAIDAKLDPTFYSVGGESMMMASDGMGCTCSYSLAGVGSNIGPLLYQPRSSRVATPVLRLALRISAVYAGHDSRLATLGKKILGSDPEAELGAIEGPMVLAPKPHFTLKDQQRSSSKDPQSLWWSIADEVDGGGLTYGSQGLSSPNNWGKSNRTYIGALLPWNAYNAREYRFEDICYKPPKRNDDDASGEPRKVSSEVAEERERSSEKKSTHLTHIHIRVELLADLDDGVWTKVAHRKSARLTIRTGGSKDPNTWRASDERGLPS